MASTTLQNVSLGIRAIGSRTDFAGGAVTDLSAEDDRLINMVLDEGFFGGADSFEVVAGSAATMNVVVGSGSAKTDLYCVAGEDAGQGNYVVRLESATETFALTAADGSLARKDEIYVVVLDDAYDSSGKALAVLALRTGDPDASPSAPGPDAAWDASALLATIDVPASAADILACTITDERIASAVNVKATSAASADSATAADAVTGYVLPFLAIDGEVRASGFSMTVDSTWNTNDTWTFTPPASWSTDNYQLVISVTALYKGVSSLAGFNERILVDGTDYGYNETGRAIPDGEYVEISHSFTTYAAGGFWMSGAVDIDLEYYATGGSGQVRGCSISITAVRYVA